MAAAGPHRLGGGGAVSGGAVRGEAAHPGGLGGGLGRAGRVALAAAGRPGRLRPDLLMHAVRPSGAGPRRHEPELLSRLSEFERELLQNQATVEPIGVRQNHIRNHVLVQNLVALNVGHAWC